MADHGSGQFACLVRIRRSVASMLRLIMLLKARIEICDDGQHLPCLIQQGVHPFVLGGGLRAGFGADDEIVAAADAAAGLADRDVTEYTIFPLSCSVLNTRQTSACRPTKTTWRRLRVRSGSASAATP